MKPYHYMTDKFGVEYSEDGTRLIRCPENFKGAFQIPNSVTSIASHAFSDCTGLTSIKIPNSVTSIGESAFSGCTGLTSIAIPNSVTSIGEKAFSGCFGLTSIEIPQSVKRLESNAFSGCTGLTSINLFNGITSIEEETFKGCTGLTSIKIPHNITRIESHAFEGCTSLTSIIVNIGNTRFCSVDGVLFNKDLTAIVRFPPGKQEQRYEIPNSVTSIGDAAFSGSTGLTAIKIPNSVAWIDSNAFAGCTGLTSVEIPNSVTSIGDAAFSGCTGLTSIKIPNSVAWIDSNAFAGCTGLTSVEIPDSVTSIGGAAFSGCTGLMSIVVNTENSSFSSVDGVLFDKNLTTIVCFPAGKQEQIYQIPDSVVCLEQYSFEGCHSLLRMSIPAAVVDINEDFIVNVGSQLEINVAEDNPIYCSVDGSLYTKDMSRLIHYCGHDLQECVIPDGVECIAPYAFERTHIAQIILPESLTEIEQYAFLESEHQELYIPSNILKIGDMAFYHSAMTKLHIRSRTPWLINVEENAFEGCAEHCTLYVPVGTETDYADCYLSDECFLETKIEHV